MPLLEIERLTMRFGGLTAIKELDLQVEPGQIVSLIGPNGAGKTTVFNVITGIYGATHGRIKLNGRVEGLPFTPLRLLTWVVVGLLTGLTLFVLSLNIDNLWKAVVSDRGNQAMTFAEAWSDTIAYVRGELRVVEYKKGRFRITDVEGQKTLGTATARAEVEKLRGHMEEIMRLGPDSQKLVNENGHWLYKGDNDVLLDEEEREEAETQLQDLAQVVDLRSQRLRFAYIGAAVGTLAGMLGAFAIWVRSRRTPEIIARGGIARTFQNIRLFQNMTVVENVLIGMDRTFSRGPIGLLIGALGLRFEERAALKKALAHLEFVSLKDQAYAVAKNLPYGAQRRLEIARALATQPKLLLLDEPAAGMNPSESVELMALIGRIRQLGVTILLIEHHMSIVMGISDQIAVLDYGVKIAQGTPTEVRNNPAVIAAYLGKEEIS